MEPFTYERVSGEQEAIQAVTRRANACFIAGGTELLNWLKEGIARPTHLVDVNQLALFEIAIDGTGLRMGALARMSDVAADADVRREFPAIAESLELSASPQLRNMASMGGNLMQRTRCPYFRAEVELPCNKRRPDSGCSALHGENRSHAIFGWSEHCVATHPSDVAVVLAALDAVVQVRGLSGERSIPVREFHRLPGDTPEIETLLEAGELITEIHVRASPLSRRSRYLKLRERASYEFALVSAAAGIELDGNRIRNVCIALGGVAPKPWRLEKAEQALKGKILDRNVLLRALEEDFADARPLTHNAFKIPLAKKAAARAILAAGGRA